MKRKLIGMALCAAVFCGMVVSAFAAQSSSEITREKFVVLLAQASNDVISETEEPIFADCENTKEVAWAYDKWIINGGSANRFQPNQKITRQEAAAILGRYLDYRYTALPGGCGTGAPDSGNISAWAQQGVMKCWMYGVIATNDAPDFRPQQTVSEEEAKQWIKNANALNMSAIGEPEKRSFTADFTAKLNPSGNYTLSPYSIRMALAMTANGAAGETQKQMCDALQISDLNAYNQTAAKQIKEYGEIEKLLTLNVSNSIWLNKDLFSNTPNADFSDAFKSSLQKFYSAEANIADVKSLVSDVNAWVKEKTNGKIPEIMDDSQKNTAVVLANAVYFKGAWSNEFLEENTEKGEFTNADGTKSKTDLMHQTGAFPYYSTPGVQILEMPYAVSDYDESTGTETSVNADMGMYIILHDDKNIDIDYVLQNAAFKTDRVSVTLPKFKIEYGETLNDALKALGMENAFNGSEADFTKMTTAMPNEGKLFVDTVLHKTYIDVNEKGTEAAAVTEVGMAGSAMPPEREPLIRSFTANKPFTFVIRDNKNEEILFVGRYETAK